MAPPRVEAARKPGLASAALFYQSASRLLRKWQL
jgi:hypothetical protein